MTSSSDTTCTSTPEQFIASPGTMSPTMTASPSNTQPGSPVKLSPRGISPTRSNLENNNNSFNNKMSSNSTSSSNISVPISIKPLPIVPSRASNNRPARASGERPVARVIKIPSETNPQSLNNTDNPKDEVEKDKPKTQGILVSLSLNFFF